MSATSPDGTRHPVSAFVRMMLSLEPWRAAGAVVLTICLSLMTGASLLLLVPLLQLIGMDVGGGALDQIAGWLKRAFDLAGVRPTLVSVLAAYVIVTAANGALTRLQGTLNHALAHNLVTRCRQRLFAAIGRTGWVFFSKSKASDYTHALVTECDRVGSIGYLLVNLVGTSVIGAAYVALAIRVSWLLTLFVFASAACLLLPLKHFRQRASGFGERSSGLYNRLHSAIADSVLGMKTVRTFGAGDRHAAIFSGLTDEMRAVSRSASRHYANVRYAFDLGTIVLLAAIVYVAFAVRHLQTAEVLLLLFLFARIMPQVSSLEQTYLTLVGELPSFSTVLDMERRCLEAAEPRPATVRPIPLRHSLELRHVSFGYGDERVIRDLDLVIRVGHTTALVGPSGAGKTTVADLIIGLMPPLDGAVLIDGIPLSPESLPSWRDQVGYVAQEAMLFHDTVRANLLWAQPTATVDELWEALRLSAADEFVAKLPQGLDTVVGDRGVLMSGGERQRLALARALVRKPALLLLDEATSSLDFENERRIRDAIDNLHGRITILIITHRLSSVRRADVIHVIDGGRLLESGRWDELMEKPGGRFRALCSAERPTGGPAEHSELEPAMGISPGGMGF